MVTYLDKILFEHRQAARADARSFDQLLEKTSSLEPCRSFKTALQEASPDLAVISEIKKASPSKGVFTRPDSLSTIEGWAQTYAEGGAACLSVLTDEAFFGGSADDLRKARAAVSLPVLRKDFTVSVNDVADARIMGADAVLLIVAALDDAELRDLSALATELGMDALVETHDEKEVERSLNIGATLIGINQRDLETFAVDTTRALRVSQAIPSDVTKVAESGIKGPSDAKALKDGGFDAILVGESLVTATDPTQAVKDLRQI